MRHAAHQECVAVARVLRRNDRGRFRRGERSSREPCERACVHLGLRAEQAVERPADREIVLEGACAKFRRRDVGHAIEFQRIDARVLCFFHPVMLEQSGTHVRSRDRMRRDTAETAADASPPRRRIAPARESRQRTSPSRRFGKPLLNRNARRRIDHELVRIAIDKHHAHVAATVDVHRQMMQILGVAWRRA